MIGELAALSASCCWAVGSHLFGRIGRSGEVPPGAMNLGKCLAALGFFAVTALVTGAVGGHVPAASPRAIGWLVASGFVGLALGDGAYFQAIVAIGVRRGLLLLSTAPVFAAIGGALCLGAERLGQEDHGRDERHRERETTSQRERTRLATRERAESEGEDGDLHRGADHSSMGGAIAAPAGSGSGEAGPSAKAAPGSSSETARSHRAPPESARSLVGSRRASASMAGASEARAARRALASYASTATTIAGLATSAMATAA